MMRRKKIRKVTVIPKKSNAIVKRPQDVSKSRMKPKHSRKSEYHVTPELYKNNEEFHNKLPNHIEKLKFLKSLNSYAQKEFNKEKRTGLPVINMVFFGHWGWVFSNMTEIYKEYAKG